MGRQTKAQRLVLRNLAEIEIQRYANNHALWHYHIHGTELDAMQLLKMEEMDLHQNTIDFSSRRTGKTTVKELYFLKFNACNPDQEGGIVAPREAQAMVNLNYHLESIRRSDILHGYLKYKSGRVQFADTYYQFDNNSIVRGYGIMANVDGGDLTWASLEEVDDMPKDRLDSRFLLMMASNRRLGASKNSKNDPQIRITGVFKGADTLSRLVESDIYHQLPVVDCNLGIELGILNEQFILNMRDQLAAEEYIRQLLCKNISTKNFIWTRYIRLAMQRGVRINLNPEQPLPGLTYKKKGLLSLGYDHTGHGERPEASKSCVVITEQIGNFFVVRYARFWPPGIDDAILIQDLFSIWQYFLPDIANGDSFGVGMLTILNDLLYKNKLTTIDRQTIKNGESSPSTWPEWPFAPMQFEGQIKHNMASILKNFFHQQHMILPYFDELDFSLDAEPYMVLKQQLSNIKELPTSKSYSAYRMVDPKVGDDGFDALMASIWGFATRGTTTVVESIILTRSQTREDLLNFNNH